MSSRIRRTTLCLAIAVCLIANSAYGADPLPSWNEGPTKKAITDFVGKVTKKDNPDFVPVAERIAVFDNDGTLWCEHPMYVQLFFALDRIKHLAPGHPDWKLKLPFKAVLDGDLKGVMESGERGVAEIIMASHAGMTTAEFETIVQDWMKTARHPRFKRPFTDLVYQPMVELMAYLRENGFKIYIVSGGGVEFMRPWTQKVYGIPPEQVIGSTIKTKYEVREGKPVLLRLPELDHLDDKGGKPESINKFIGRRPIMAFGNSDGDFQMLEWTTSGSGPRFGLLVHHTDGKREYDYDRLTPFGRLSKGLDEAPKRNWIVADMKADWKRVFAFDE